MRYVYFTKTLQPLTVPELIAFCKDVGLDGVDLAVRPGYPVHPENVAAELPRAAKAFRDEGLTVGLVTAATNLIDPESKTAPALFEACGKAGVTAIKIGYFPYKDRIDDALAQARQRLAGFAKLSARTGVRACYHTHSGSNLGNNAAGLRLLLQDADPHAIGAFVDTGHLAVNGGPFRMELDLVRSWLSLVAIKDMAWERTKQGWRYRVVPASEGIVRWDEVGQALKERGYNGTISLHGEYETRDLADRKELAKQELALLKMRLGG
jgi:sugar phosphate isomerase/epimerase